jgi:hypothetical protein
MLGGLEEVCQSRYGNRFGVGSPEAVLSSGASVSKLGVTEKTARWSISPFASRVVA